MHVSSASAILELFIFDRLKGPWNSVSMNMKKVKARICLLSAILTFLSANAMACPNLTGVYSCENSNGPSTITIAQDISNLVTTYSIENFGAYFEYVADGIARPGPFFPYIGPTSAICKGGPIESLEAVSAVKRPLYDATQTLNYSLVSADHLQILFKLDFGGAPKVTSTLCARIQK